MEVIRTYKTIIDGKEVEVKVYAPKAKVVEEEAEELEDEEECDTLIDDYQKDLVDILKELDIE